MRIVIITLGLAAGAAVKYVVNEHIALGTKIVLAILAPITIERTHALAHVCRRSGLESQRTRMTVRAGLGV